VWGAHCCPFAGVDLTRAAVSAQSRPPYSGFRPADCDEAPKHRFWLLNQCVLAAFSVASNSTCHRQRAAQKWLPVHKQRWPPAFDRTLQTIVIRSFLL